MGGSAKALEELLRCCTAIHIDAQRFFYQPAEIDDFLDHLADIQKKAWEIYEILRDRLHEISPKALVSSRRFAYFIINYRDSHILEDEVRDEAGTIPLLISESDKCLREIEEEYRLLTRSSIVEELSYSFPARVFPSDITEAINSMYVEALNGFQNGCLTSSIAMSGKVIETVLSALYAKVTGNDADKEKLGADALINRLKKSGYPFKGTLKEQLGIVKVHRNKAVHGSVIVPTIDEARGVLSLARDVLQKSAISIDKGHSQSPIL